MNKILEIFRGITLIEVMILVAILSILLAGVGGCCAINSRNAQRESEMKTLHKYWVKENQDHSSMSLEDWKVLQKNKSLPKGAKQ